MVGKGEDKCASFLKAAEGAHKGQVPPRCPRDLPSLPSARPPLDGS